MKYTRNPFVRGLALSQSDSTPLAIKSGASAHISSTRPSFRRGCLISAGALTLLASSSYGQTFRNWTGGQNSNWQHVNNWSGGEPDTITEVAQFNAITGNDPNAYVNAVTIGGFSLTGGEARSLTFSNTIALDQYGVDNSSALSLNIGGTGSTSLTAAQTWSVSGTGNTAFGKAIANGGFLLTLDASNTGTGTISSDISGTGGITKIGTGTGTWTLGGTNGYTGITSVTAGTLSVSGSINGSSTINISGGLLSTTGVDKLANAAAVTVSGGTLTVGGSDTVGTLTMSSGSIGGSNTLTATTYNLSGGTVTGYLGAGTLNSSGTVALNGTAGASAVNVTAGTLTLGSSDRLANSATVAVSGGTLAIGGSSDTVGLVSLASGSITGSGGTLTGSSYAVQSGSISAILGGTGVNLTKSTAGTVTLGGANTYTGTTTVEAGTLTLDSNGAISSTLVLGTSGGGTGTLDASVKSSITLASVTGSGTIKGNVNITSVLGPGYSPGTINVIGDLTLGGITTMELGVISDELNVTGALNLNGILAITGTITPATNFDLFDYGTISGNFSSVSVGGQAFTRSGDVWSGSYGGENYIFSQTTGVITSVPEPAAALFGGLGLLALLRRRRNA